MKKLLGLFICFAVIATMGAGLTGCKKEEPADAATKKKLEDLKKAEDAKTEVKLKTATLELKANTKNQEVEIEITEKAAEKFNIEVSMEGVGKVSGDGTFAKDATKATIKITTDEGAKDGELTLTVLGEKNKGTPKLKATIK